MDKTEIQNLIRELIEKTNVDVKEISIVEELPANTWFKVEVAEPHFYINNEGEGLFALNHLVRRIVESKISPVLSPIPGIGGGYNFMIDINGFQGKKVEALKAVAYMMAERARYFKANVEVDPMSSFERRIIHEFLSNEIDLKTESVGFGPNRRVVIKYTGTL